MSPLSLSLMLPLLPAANHIHCCRYLVIYILNAIYLPDEDHGPFLEGQFSVHQSARIFNGIPTDHFQRQGKGGIVGITGNRLALLRWTLTHHATGDYAAAMHEFCAGESLDEKIHEECQTAAMKRDEDHVQTWRSHIKNSMTNPFDITSHAEVLINI